MPVFLMSAIHYGASHSGIVVNSGNSGKELVCQCRRCGFDPQVEKIPWKWVCNPLQYSCLENPMDRGAWQTTHSISKSRTQLKQLSNQQPRNKIIYMPTKHVSKPTLKPNFEVSFLWACPSNNYYKFQNPKREQMLHAKRVIFAIYYSGFKSSSGYFSFFFFCLRGILLGQLEKI